MADPDVALEAHDHGAVDGAHHGDLHEGHEDGQEQRVDLEGVEAPQVLEAVQQEAAQAHRQVVESQDLF